MVESLIPKLNDVIPERPLMPHSVELVCTSEISDLELSLTLPGNLWSSSVGQSVSLVDTFLMKNNFTFNENNGTPGYFAEGRSLFDTNARQNTASLIGARQILGDTINVNSRDIFRMQTYVHTLYRYSGRVVFDMYDKYPLIVYPGKFHFKPFQVEAIFDDFPKNKPVVVWKGGTFQHVLEDTTGARWIYSYRLPVTTLDFEIDPNAVPYISSWSYDGFLIINVIVSNYLSWSTINGYLACTIGAFIGGGQSSNISPGISGGLYKELTRRGGYFTDSTDAPEATGFTVNGDPVYNISGLGLTGFYSTNTTPSAFVLIDHDQTLHSWWTWGAATIPAGTRPASRMESWLTNTVYLFDTETFNEIFDTIINNFASNGGNGLAGGITQFAGYYITVEETALYGFEEDAVVFDAVIRRDYYQTNPYPDGESKVTIHINPLYESPN